ncbi:cytochrome C [Polaromonas sp. A23]|uniref:c-type cytochrome n=1 Tax=Polaromonas sp. A23 TaxID=1944133 RepID=UPI0009851892|nr:cytochrome C [Polaromonas sp. A23]OOG43782.1 cytochrome C [Polaromonas sp. A23]
MKIALPTLALAFCTLAAPSLSHAQNAPAQALHVRSLAATCANCHGTDGKVVPGSPVLSIAGMEKNYIVAQLKAFKSGTRPATVMHQISKGFSDAQIEVLAGYFAAQKK